MDNDLHHYHEGPPDTKEDWQRIYRAVHRADQTWVVTKPMVAFTLNWKAWLFGLSMLLLLQHAKVQAALKALSDLIWGTK